MKFRRFRKLSICFLWLAVTASSSGEESCDADTHDSGEVATRGRELAQAEDMGERQQLGQGIDRTAETTARIQKAREYIQSVDLPQSLKDLCLNKHELCTLWAIKGECDTNPKYMKSECAPVCYSCEHLFQQASSSGEESCEANTTDPEATACGPDLSRAEDMGERQQLAESSGREAKISARIQKAREYIQSVDISPGLKDLCLNKHEMCAIWAVEGECDANPKYMKLDCAPVCYSCEHLSVEGRCPIDPSAPNVFGPGDIGSMFQKLTNEPYLSQYSVEILSQPPGRPWVIQMDDILSKDEAETMIELGFSEGFERSADVGPLKADGTFEPNVNDRRTSSNTWCATECYEHEVAKRVNERLSNFTGVPHINSEHLQLLRYEPGQFYQTHHDYIKHHLQRQQGVRVLTFYLYLNDVKAGGGTNFPELNVTVTPKQGRGVLWTNVLVDQPHEADGRTKHQALPVEEGIKFGCNAWFHMRDFMTPYGNNCI